MLIAGEASGDLRDNWNRAPSTFALADSSSRMRTRFDKAARFSVLFFLFVQTTFAQTNLSAGFTGFRDSPQFNERVASFTFNLDVKVHINAPMSPVFTKAKKVLLVFFTLPNGNTTEQTIGRKLQPGDYWHFDIQHIGAQTRFLREMIKDRVIVVAYLEAEMKSWPAWRKKHGDTKIPEIISTVRGIFTNNPTEIVLSGHSGGGSFIFGYMNAVEKIPDGVTRIAFLDSNYAYNTTNHLAKLTAWLKASKQHRLCVLAYHDDIALLNGKSFVSAEGGTWGRSHAMLKDLGATFKFSNQQLGDGLEKVSALDGRIQFLLKENPEKKIFHTVQVERNGFIHAIAFGTANEGKGYEYFGDRAYVKWIQEN